MALNLQQKHEHAKCSVPFAIATTAYRYALVAHGSPRCPEHYLIFALAIKLLLRFLVH